MSDFKFLKNPVSGKWVVSAPRRAKRTNVGSTSNICPFCPGQEAHEEELYRNGGLVGDSDWHIRVIANKFPFAPHHEVIIHSPDHHKNWDELPFSQVELILNTYRERFNYHVANGPHSAKASRGKQVYIFHNRGHAAGESLQHPHTQLVVIPETVKLDITPLDLSIYGKGTSTHNQVLWKGLLRRSEPDDNEELDSLETEHFLVFCPKTSEWPDEVWIAPKKNGQVFGMINDKEITDMAFVLSRIVQIFDLRHGHEFPFNFYISPHRNWYLRLIPRTKIIGGFELGTNMIVNTQDPKETYAFIKEHFWEPDQEKIKAEHQAKYHKSV